MSRLRLLVSGFVLAAVAGCGALKDAMTSHANLAARAGSQELTVDGLAKLLAESRVPLRPDVARGVLQVWVDYALVGSAAVAGDTLVDPELAEQGLWAQINQMKIQTYFERYAQSLGRPDSATFEKAYNDGAMLAAAHILLTKQPDGLGQNDSIRAEAERIARSVTPATFAQVARQRSQDPGSSQNGGRYDPWAPGMMVPEFEQGVRSVPPGGITGVVESQYGYHIIRRLTWDEAKASFAQNYPALLQQKAESTFFASVSEGANIRVKESAAPLVKAIAEDPYAYSSDRTVVASSRKGDIRADRVSLWLLAFPPQSQIRSQIAQSPDSLILQFVRNIVENELLVAAADSAGITIDSTEMAGARAAFQGSVVQVMGRLNLAPGELAATAPDKAAREALARQRIDDYITRLVRNEAEYVEVPEPVLLVLRDRYEARTVPAVIEKVLAEATRLRAAADSAAAATQPPTAVPMPGAPTAAPAAPTTPAPAAPTPR